MKKFSIRAAVNLHLTGSLAERQIRIGRDEYESNY
mgnify:FL=1